MRTKREVLLMDMDEKGFKWPVDWSAVWVGALAAVAVALIFGLAGIALGAQKIGGRGTSWNGFSLGALIFRGFGALLAFVAGGWSACRIGGFRASEKVMLH